MAAFRLLGAINHIGPHQFFVTASAVPEEGGEGALVETGEADSRIAAKIALTGLLSALEEEIRRRGDIVAGIAG